MLAGFAIKQIQMRNQGKNISLKKNLSRSCNKPMVEIKDDDSPNDERCVFTLPVVKTQTNSNCNCRKY